MEAVPSEEGVESGFARLYYAAKRTSRTTDAGRNAVTHEKRGHSAYTEIYGTSDDAYGYGCGFRAFCASRRRRSLLSKTGALQAKDILTKRARSQWSLRRIRTFEEDFELTGFIPLSQEVYVKAHESLMSLDMDTLRDYVTEKAMAEMTAGMESKTVRWKFHEMIELPRVSQVRATHIMQKSNYYAQITVRMHSRQSLAIYDRFGRLMYGNEDRVKDVLEYVVFERHLADPHGKWRVHAKIVPDWMPVRDPIIATYRKPRSGDLKPSEDWLKKQAEKSKIKGEEGDAPPEEPGAPSSGKSDAESRKQQVAIA